MRLYELAFACHVYNQMTDYDTSYRDFLQATNHAPDLSITQHCIALLEWLNKWRCRQFAKEYYELATEQIGLWYEGSAALLPPPSKPLCHLSEAEIVSACTAYGRLANRLASKRDRYHGWSNRCIKDSLCAQAGCPCTVG